MSSPTWQNAQRLPGSRFHKTSPVAACPAAQDVKASPDLRMAPD